MLDLTPEQRSRFVATLLASSMHGAAHWSDRLDAALALRDFPHTPELVAALSAAVSSDPEYLVRYHAANTLLTWAGLPPEITTHTELFGDLTADVETDPEAPQKWARVAADLSARIPG